jgi:fatty-acyl-CoA synthase
MPIGRGQGSGAAVRGAVDGKPPDYICAWLGLFKVGAQVALINTNLAGRRWPIPCHLRRQPCDCGRGAGGQFPRAPFENRRRCGSKARGGTSPPRWRTAQTSPGKSARAGVTLKERAFFIYTSGTTGLPKAANFSHMRMLFMMSGFVGALRPRETTASMIPCRSIIPPAGCVPWAWRFSPAGR